MLSVSLSVWPALPALSTTISLYNLYKFTHFYNRPVLCHPKCLLSSIFFYMMVWVVFTESNKLIFVSLIQSSFSLLSHVLLRSWPCGAFHPVSIRPQTPGGDNHSVQLQPRLHSAGRRHHYLLRPWAGDPRVDVSTASLCLWVSERHSDHFPVREDPKVSG